MYFKVYIFPLSVYTLAHEIQDGYRKQTNLASEVTRPTVYFDDENSDLPLFFSLSPRSLVIFKNPVVPVS